MGFPSHAGEVVGEAGFLEAAEMKSSLRLVCFPKGSRIPAVIGRW
jgi:hypothetical protein